MVDCRLPSRNSFYFQLQVKSQEKWINFFFLEQFQVVQFYFLKRRLWLCLYTEHLKNVANPGSFNDRFNCKYGSTTNCQSSKYKTFHKGLMYKTFANNVSDFGACVVT